MDFQVFENRGLIDVDNFVFKFEALAKSDIHVVFTAIRTDRTPISWELVLGANGNTRSLIRVGTSGVSSKLLRLSFLLKIGKYFLYRTAHKFASRSLSSIIIGIQVDFNMFFLQYK